jgi:hypothetical protein
VEFGDQWSKNGKEFIAERETFGTELFFPPPRG